MDKVKKNVFLRSLKLIKMSEGITKEELIEQFKGNKILKVSTTVVGIVVAIVLLFLAYKNFISTPKNEASKAEVAKGIMLMESDSLNAAIEELEYVASQYSGYDGGHQANYLLGGIFLKQGRYEDALNAFGKVKFNDTYLMALTYGAQGDCYSELGDYAKAASLYIKAAKHQDNNLTTPEFLFKAGINAEEAGDFAKATDFYKEIKDKYSTFANQKNIEKFITRASAKI